METSMDEFLGCWEQSPLFGWKRASRAEAEKVWLDFHPFASHPFSSVTWFHLIITTVVASKTCLYPNLNVSSVRSEKSFTAATFLESSDNWLPPAVGGIISEQFHASFQVTLTKCLFCYFIWRTRWYVLLLLHRICSNIFCSIGLWRSKQLFAKPDAR